MPAFGFCVNFVHEIAVGVMAASKQRHWESVGYLPVDEAVHWVIVDFLSPSDLTTNHVLTCNSITYQLANPFDIFLFRSFKLNFS